MSIKCGRCSNRHDTVEQVRACFNGQDVPSTKENLSAGLRATPKQASYLEGLMRKASARLMGNRMPDELGRQEISGYIDAMKRYLQTRPLKLPNGFVYDEARMSADGDPEGYGSPNAYPSDIPPAARPGSDEVEQERWRRDERRAAAAIPLPDVPAGHYAIPSLTGNNDLDFFRVDRPTEGRWAGRTFVKRVIGGRPDSPVRGRTAREALTAIAKDPGQAAFQYGQSLGRCYKCNRHLTDELSRSLSIGPDCRSKAS